MTKQKDDEFEDISENEEYDFIQEHILDLVKLIKELNENSILDFEKYWENYLKTHRDDFEFWRGAKTRVVEFKGAKSNPKWEELINNMPSYDDPCATRYPHLMSSLIFRMCEKFVPYANFANKFFFIDNIVQNCHELENKFDDLDKHFLCKYILNDQIRFLSNWSKDTLKIIFNVDEEPNLFHKGWVVYFAFGRNVNSKAMLSKRRCPDGKLLGPGVLYDYKFIIDKRGYASIKPSKNSQVHGVLWLISPEDNERLDLREGVRINIYRKEILKVHALYSGFEDFKALVYISNSEEGFFAKDGYIEEIVEGLKREKVPVDDFNIYLDHIRTTKH